MLSSFSVSYSAVVTLACRSHGCSVLRASRLCTHTNQIMDCLAESSGFATEQPKVLVDSVPGFEALIDSGRIGLLKVGARESPRSVRPNTQPKLELIAVSENAARCEMLLSAQISRRHVQLTCVCLEWLDLV